jgi:uncharacterized protein
MREDNSVKVVWDMGEQEKASKPNRLINEKSPYLLQHAHNPVDWYPWGDEAFSRAEAENKPIFLSIGYSTCHWCHVMEHESFQDAEVAQAMNEAFISIKVDREERPDIDSVYMEACQMMTGGGGWPLTIIMTPDRRPFYAATYIPRERRYGHGGMLELIPQIRSLWLLRRGEAILMGKRILDMLREETTGQTRYELNEELLGRSFEQLMGRFDPERGGFGDAPRFPSAHILLFLLRYWRRTGRKMALRMVEKTLEAMQSGGIYDHIGLGFHRYSTDEEWLVPHFEKMLYDQAMLSIAYAEAFQATRRKDFMKTAREILTYVQRDMTSPGGGFFSAEDADSEGEEGKFYLWDYDELMEILGREEGELFASCFGIAREGNFEDQQKGERSGKNIPHLTKSVADLATERGIDEGALHNRLDAARQKLFLHRENRMRPFKDDKILADWNGLMIAAFAIAGRVFDDGGYVDTARRAASFILKKMKIDGSRLLHRIRHDKASINGMVHDYAFMTWGLLELYETTFDTAFLKEALAFNETMLEHFWDEDQGGFYTIADDGEDLLVRKKETYDGAIPSANSIAFHNLMRLARITGEERFEEKADLLGQALSAEIVRAPHAHSYFLSVLDFVLGPSYEIVITGNAGDESTADMLRALNEHFIPNCVKIFRPPGDEGLEITKLAPYTLQQHGIGGKTTVYICVNHACHAPMTDKEKVLEFIGPQKAVAV